MNVAKKIGWVIVERTKNYRRGRIVGVWHEVVDGKLIPSLSGYGTLYYQKNQAKQDAQSLNKEWGEKKMFIVRKAILMA